MRLQIAIVIMIEWSTNKGDRERLCLGTKKGRAENADPPKAMPPPQTLRTYGQHYERQNPTDVKMRNV